MAIQGFNSHSINNQLIEQMILITSKEIEITRLTVLFKIEQI